MSDLLIHNTIDTIYRSTLIPGFICALWLSGVLSFFAFKLCLLGALVIFVLLPIIYRFCLPLQRSLVFLTFVRYPPNVDYNKPQLLGLYGTRNMYLTHNDPDTNAEVTLGVWHILPKSLVQYFGPSLGIDATAMHNFTVQAQGGDVDEGVPDDGYELGPEREAELARIKTKYLSDGEPVNVDKLYEELLRKMPHKVILYLHGNAGHRGAGHRVELYQLLQRLDCHVIALDYRQYGDSSKVLLSEAGVVRDAMKVYNYVKSITDAPVFVWGHSLGTGVATHLVSLVEQQKKVTGPQGVILESPFSNIRDEVREHPFAKIFRPLPWFDMLIADPLYNNYLRFESDNHIGEFRQPVMILHAEDDLVVPFKLGYKLYRRALDIRGKAWGPVEFHRFENSSRFGHKFICRAKNLPNIVSSFTNSYAHTRF